MKKVISRIFVVICLVVIFAFSNMDSNESNSKSKKTINSVVTETVKVKDEVENKINNTSNTTSKEEIEKITDKLNLPLRKVMHSLEYFVLFILILNALSFNKKNMIISSILCLVYAITDEIHQLFVLDRTGRLLDILIDMSSIIFVIFIYYLYNFIKKRTYIKDSE